MNQQDEIHYLLNRIVQLQQQTEVVVQKKSEFKIWIFIIILILFWPAALVYAVYWGFKK